MNWRLGTRWVLLANQSSRVLHVTASADDEPEPALRRLANTIVGHPECPKPVRATMFRFGGAHELGLYFDRGLARGAAVSLELKFGSRISIRHGASARLFRILWCAAFIGSIVFGLAMQQSLRPAVLPSLGRFTNVVCFAVGGLGGAFLGWALGFVLAAAFSRFARDSLVAEVSSLLAKLPSDPFAKGTR